MAQISRFLFMRHLRGEQSSHLLHFANGRLVREGRGLSFWFLPLSASIAEVPIDDREQAFLFRGRTIDFQEFSVQGVITYRVANPTKVAQRVPSASMCTPPSPSIKRPRPTASSTIVRTSARSC